MILTLVAIGPGVTEILNAFRHGSTKIKTFIYSEMMMGHSLSFVLSNKWLLNGLHDLILKRHVSSDYFHAT